MSKRKMLPIRGFLIHITHYDPVWWAGKARERPFDLNVGLEVTAAAGLDGERRPPA